MNLPLNGARTSSSAASRKRSNDCRKFKRGCDIVRCCGRGRPHSVQLPPAGLSRISIPPVSATTSCPGSRSLWFLLFLVWVPILSFAATNHGLQTVFKVVSSKIRYAVLCYGVPLRIAEDPSIKEEHSEKLRPEQRE